jgi:ElaB/YqjD/DUF883 family membrane-anchored ribosome-binding protein
MAERNPVMPVNNPEPNLVAWPGAGSTATPSGTEQSGGAEVVQAASEKIEAAGEKIKETWQTGITAAEDSLQRARHEVSRRANTAMNAVRRFADEQPLRFVAIVAGAAFLVGVALRVWRSSRYES